MANDWLPMRVWLRKDPKVICMSDTLERDQKFLDWLSPDAENASLKASNESVTRYVTRNVTRYIVVTALLEFWGVAREQGIRFGDDLVINPGTLKVIDNIVEIPNFGLAMQSVGWASINKKGELILPKFFAEKESPYSRHRNSNAERQARYRDKKRNEGVTDPVTSNVTRNVTDPVTSNVTRNVTVTSTLPHRREEERTGVNTEIHTTPSPPSGDLFAGVGPVEEKPPSKEVVLPFSSKEFSEAWADWVQHRKDIRKPLKPKTIQVQLKDLASWGEENAIRSIRESIRNSWQGLFEPKGERGGNYRGNGQADRNLGRVVVPPGKYDNLKIQTVGPETEGESADPVSPSDSPKPF